LPAQESNSDNQASEVLSINDTKGLSSERVKEKQKQYGRNEVSEKKTNPLAQNWAPLISWDNRQLLIPHLLVQSIFCGLS
jgi:magnesium-transporting ATPase (P-type)